MGTSFQVVVAAGDENAVRAAVAATGQEADVRAIGESRWAVVPATTEHEAYAETDELARHLSEPAGAVAASFQVFDSDVLLAGLYRAGRHYHDYLSDQAYLMEYWEDDGTELMVDMLGRPYGPDDEPPTGPYGADVAAFLPFAAGPVDSDAVAAALTATTEMAEDQFHQLLHALNMRAFM
ncbi:hypothetical protein [Actinoplanes sp. NPDC049265]|uniref:hypothetical protein n=1 Tax=Actinoplanes sp. NPDC049265 TaxID=3363902 RepID=UPI00371A1777